MISIETLDSNNWIPVELTYNSTRTAPLSAYTQQYTTGFTFHLNRLLTNILDVSIQYDAFTALKDTGTLTDAFVEQTTARDPNLIGSSILKTFDGKALTFNATTLVPELCAVTENNQYHRLVFGEHTVEVLYKEIYSLTVDTTDMSLFYSPRLNSLRDSQLFYYTLSGNQLTLTTTLTSVTSQYTVQYNNTSCAVVLASGQFVSGSAISNRNFWTLGNTQPSIVLGFDYKQYWHQYHNGFGPVSNRTTVNIDESKTIELSGNHLITFPLSPVVSNGGQARVDIVPLKNCFNHKHHQLPTPSAYSSYESPLVRNYDRLSFPVNQTEGVQDPGLIFHTNQQEILLPCDQTTIFHIPYNAISHPLSSSDLAAMGATPGHTPAYSDRINKRLFGYNCSTDNGNNSQTSNGTLLCSWLSGDQFNCQWVDRWYDGNNVTQGSALIATVTAVGTATQIDYVWDIPSKMILDPGVSYSYFRQGPTSQTAALHNDTASNTLLKIDQWYPPTDSSAFNNPISVHNADYYLGSESAFVANGSNSLTIAMTPSMAKHNQITLAGWVHVDNWLSANANQLIGSFYESGFGLTYSSGVYSIENITYGDSNYGFVTTLDNQYNKFKQLRLPSIYTTPSISDIAVTRNFNKWMLDTANHAAYCVDYNNTIVASVMLPASSSFQFLQVDSHDAVYTFDQRSHTIVKFTTQGVVTAITTNASANNFAVDSQDQIITSITNPGTLMSVDSQGVLWRIVGNNVYKGSDIVFHGGTGTMSIALDCDDNVWVARGTNKVYKLNNQGILLAETVLPSVFSSNDIHLNIIREQTPQGIADYVMATAKDLNKMVKISMDGKIVTCIDLRAVADVNVYTYRNNISATVRGDITGYDVHRKFERTPSVSGKVRVDDVNGQTSTLTVTCPASSLTSGWHHLAMTFDNNAGTLNLYIDGSPVDTISFDANAYLINYKYRSPLTICGDSGKYGLLKDELSFTNTSGFIGKVDRVRYYSVALSTDQVRALVAEKTKFNDLHWALHTNNRYPQVEHIMSWFTHRLQTHKSNAFDIVIKQSNIEDEVTKTIIEDAVRRAVSKIKPGHTQLREIRWI